MRTMIPTRIALLLGFGGLLALLVFTGLDAVRLLTQMRDSNTSLRREFLERSSRLDDIRSKVYLSGTLVRDYVLEPEHVNAERQRDQLNANKSQVESEIEAYGRLLPEQERGAFEDLRRELSEYWQSLDPIFSWDAAQRRSGGIRLFARQSVPASRHYARHRRPDRTRSTRARLRRETGTLPSSLSSTGIASSALWALRSCWDSWWLRSAWLASWGWSARQVST